MSDLGDEYRDRREAQKMRRIKRLPLRQDEILSLRKEGFSVLDKNGGYQFRINGYIDLFPIHQRYHDLRNNKRGSYRNIDDIKKLLR